ncbi:MAG TPA: ATP-binding cassette domain-containing protein, partial [Ktedonobacterales bacterium]|nr:ATP-binding cassette domain-containing protein [Ktedonobacterales bacterium]
MLEAQHISMSRGGKTLLADASCMIGRSEKVGIVGANGAGKTTFLRVLRGELEPDAGVVFRPKRIGYLGQERLADALLTGADDGADPASVTVREVMLSGRDLARLADELRRLEAALATTTGDELDAVLARYGDAEERFQRLGGYDAEHEIGALLEGLGLAEVALEQPIATLSGGQKTRLALARTLFTTHDLLLLDEPTNHLDGPA